MPIQMLFQIPLVMLWVSPTCWKRFGIDKLLSLVALAWTTAMSALLRVVLCPIGTWMLCKENVSPKCSTILWITSALGWLESCLFMFPCWNCKHWKTEWKKKIKLKDHGILQIAETSLQTIRIGKSFICRYALCSLIYRVLDLWTLGASNSEYYFSKNFMD